MSVELSIAPLMGYTNPYFIRFYADLLPEFIYFSEMIHANAVIHNQAWYDYADLPVKPVMQLGGSDPILLAKACRLLKEKGLNAVNLNLGCPSPRVQKGSFGACLMKEVALVQDCLKAMIEEGVNVSIKCRLGVDEYDSDDFLLDFLEPLLALGIEDCYVHARIALLKGLTPKQNREIPPINYERAARVKAHFPEVKVHLNGEITPSLDCVEKLGFAGYMFGRSSYQAPRNLLDLLPERSLSSEEITARIKLELVRLGQSTMSINQLRFSLMPLHFWTKCLPSGKNMRQKLTQIQTREDCLRLVM